MGSASRKYKSQQIHTPFFSNSTPNTRFLPLAFMFYRKPLVIRSLFQILQLFPLQRGRKITFCILVTNHLIKICLVLCLHLQRAKEYYVLPLLSSLAFQLLFSFPENLGRSWILDYSTVYPSNNQYMNSRIRLADKENWKSFAAEGHMHQKNFDLQQEKLWTSNMISTVVINIIEHSYIL